MTKEQNSKLKKLGIFTLAQAEELGLSQQNISRLVQANELKRVSRGIYAHPNAEIDQYVGFRIACTKFGSNSVVGGLSALSYYNLVEQVPGQIWIIVPPERHSNEKSYRLVRTKTDLKQNVISKDGFKIVSLERAILEGLKLSTKIGERIALKAARTALSSNQTTLNKLSKTAKNLGLESILTKYFEAIVP